VNVIGHEFPTRYQADEKSARIRLTDVTSNSFYVEAPTYGKVQSRQKRKNKEKSP